MTKERTTILKTRLAKESGASDASALTKLRDADTRLVSDGHCDSTAQSSPETIVAADSEPKSSTETIVRSTIINDDPLANTPTVANLTSEATRVDEDSVFARLDRRVSEQYANNKVLKQRFVLTKTLGAGGMGNVYLAKDLLREELEDSTPHVAIKVLNDECRRMPGALQALQSEAKKAQTLSHPNIVTVFDFDRDGETAFITMEYIEGSELKDLIRKSKIPYAKAMMIIEKVARGLAYAHQQGFVHADIKPANIFCGHNDIVKILDFGISKAFTEATKETRSLGDQLTEGALTPAYASLEMLMGEPPHPADDVYSLFCMAYELLSGRHPFMDKDGHSISAVEAKALGLKPQLIPGLSRRHMNALRKGLAFDRCNRYQDAGEVIDAIKPRSFKKEVILLIAAAVATIVIMYSGGQALDNVVPRVESLKPELAQVAKTINEADEFVVSEDIDFAHRLYSQAWILTNDLTGNDLDERDKARAILSDRMEKISNVIIEKSKNKQLDEFELRELLLALEFLLKDEIADNDKKIQKAIESIKRRIE